MEARRPVTTACVFMLFVLTAEAQESKPSLEILPHGELHTKAIGSNILLTCTPKVAEPKLISDIKWIDPQNRVIESLNYVATGQSKPTMYTEILPNNAIRLFINSLTEEQAGRYICKAHYANTQMLSKDVTIESIVAITWDNAPPEQYPILGEDFAVSCQVRARPSPTVDWLYNDEVIRTNDHYVIETHALRIKNVRESDDGVYTCRASVPETGELQERAIRVEVHVRPKIEEANQGIVEVIEGENADVVCKSSGKPPPRYSWIKSLTKEDLAVTDRFGVNADTGVLTITNARREDTGEYQCRAENKAGADTMNIQLSVIVKPKIMEFINATVNKDNTVTLSCKAFGRPPPFITFRKHTAGEPFRQGTQSNDDRIKLDNEPDDINGETTGVLTIDRVLRSDDGMYECIAENKGGKAWKNGHITVQFPPSFESMTNRTIYSWDMKPVNLTCIAESIPNATIFWTFYGDRRVDNDPQIQIFGNGPISSLYIKPIDRRYYTQYRCNAFNTLGERSHLIDLREAPKPAEILQATLTEVTATTMTFSIVPPVAEPDLPIRTISVQYKRQDTPWTVALNRTWAVGSTAGYVVENLDPQTNYEFRFAAANEAGRGQWGMNKMFSTTMRNVPGPVRFLASTSNNYAQSHFHDRYNVKWSQAPDNGERIDYYEVKWCQAQRYSGDQWEVSESCQFKMETKRETWITDLNADTYYKIEIRAHNILGLGTAANLTVKTTRESEGFVVEEQFTSGGAAIQLAINFIAATMTMLYVAI